MNKKKEKNIYNSSKLLKKNKFGNWDNPLSHKFLFENIIKQGETNLN